MRSLNEVYQEYQSLPQETLKKRVDSGEHGWAALSVLSERASMQKIGKPPGVPDVTVRDMVMAGLPPDKPEIPMPTQGFSAGGDVNLMPYNRHLGTGALGQAPSAAAMLEQMYMQREGNQFVPQSPEDLQMLNGESGKTVLASLSGMEPPEQIQPIRYAQGGQVGLTYEERLAAAVRHVESRGNKNAVSSKGARGAMQTMPGTETDPGYGVRPVGPGRSREDVGVDYLAAMGREYPNSRDHQLAAYNWGPGNAAKWDGNPANLPKETRDYINRVNARMGEDTRVRADTVSTPRPRDNIAGMLAGMSEEKTAREKAMATLIERTTPPKHAPKGNLDVTYGDEEPPYAKKDRLELEKLLKDLYDNKEVV